MMQLNKDTLLKQIPRQSQSPGAKFAGSGGSIVGFYPDNKTLTKLIIEMKKVKARVIKPFIF